MNKKKIMAICDTEASYACRLMEYIEERHSLPYEIHAFTTADKLCEFAGQRDIDVLLISEPAVDERIERIPVERRVVLTDGVSGEDGDILHINKFQSAGAILSQISASSPGAAAGKTETKRTADRRIYGVYSPCGGSEATAFAIALAAVLAEKKETLYINLRNFSGIEQLSGEMFDRTLGDLLYYYRRGTGDLQERAAPLIRQMDAVDIIPPSASPTDLQEISGAEWTELLDILIKEGDYGHCVLELSDGVRDIAEVLELCAHIYLPTRSDPIARAALEQFADCMRETGHTELLTRCMPTALPLPDHTEGKALFRETAEGRYGRCARRVLAEEGSRYGITAGIAESPSGQAGRKRRIIRRRNPRSDR